MTPKLLPKYGYLGCRLGHKLEFDIHFMIQIFLRMPISYDSLHTTSIISHELQTGNAT